MVLLNDRLFDIDLNTLWVFIGKLIQIINVCESGNSIIQCQETIKNTLTIFRAYQIYF